MSAENVLALLEHNTLVRRLERIKDTAYAVDAITSTIKALEAEKECEDQPPVWYTNWHSGGLHEAISQLSRSIGEDAEWLLNRERSKD